jgi:hypothetical protein
VLHTGYVLWVFNVIERVFQMIDDFKALNIFYILHRLPLEKMRGVENCDKSLNDAENTASVKVIREKRMRENAKK